MLYVCYSIVFLTLLACTIIVAEDSMLENKTDSKILSRRKRFLTFPDGSSFQLVFETQNHGYLQIGDVVWFSTTAALAWELPTDPNLFYMFKDKSKLYESPNRKSGVIYYLDDEGKVIDKKAYKRKIIINPAFGKRSIDSKKDNNIIISKKLIKEMHRNQKNTDHFKDLNAGEIEFHRNGRQELYGKIKIVLEKIGWTGEDCVLQMLCQTSRQQTADQGNLLDEIIRAVFTLPKGHVQTEVHNQYDDAHGANGDCAHLYPNCEHSSEM